MEGRDYESAWEALSCPPVKLMRPPSMKNLFACLNGQNRWDHEGHWHMQGDRPSLDEVGTGREPRLPGGLPACEDQVEGGWRGGVGREEAGLQEQGAVGVLSTAERRGEMRTIT